MKKVVIVGPRRAELIDVSEPQPKADWVVVKVQVAPMCTEYKLFVAGTPQVHLGHEAAGEVVAVAQPGRVKVGDRVVVMPTNGCGTCALCSAGDYIHCENGVNFTQFHGSPEGSTTMLQYLVKPDWLLLPIPTEVSYEHASLACCGLGPSFGAFDRMGLSVFDTLLITGLGPVGLGAVVNARYRGARIIAVESHPWRMERARQMGADLVLDPRSEGLVQQIKELTGGKGVDCALDCSGTLQAQRLCIDATRRKGKIAFVGECQDELAIRISPDMIRKGLTLIGSWHYNLQCFPALMQVIQKSPLLEQLISHRFPMSQVQQAFTLQTTGQSAKVLLDPWG